MEHPGFSISTHLFEFFDERFVLKGGLTGVALTLRFALSGIRQYRIRVALQLFFNLRFQHRTKCIFIWAI
ncbi:hypothetical protein PS914_05727 [Pseudomonas fluorescens]|nr:hypothetical protein PS914_05727 [Pseudomonas fluorescens]